ncbi:MAG: hypothetical protein A2X94_03000 [Bdellovibrionales bacterium GWB1_55_8]|nr:MAG: hypothetical protein A2X94_03000 [Bdellovibrionales bacterium GWB1_55_8]
MALTASSGSAFSYFEPSVIYGEDSRLDYFEISNPRVRQLTDSVPAFFRASDFELTNQSARFSAPTYQKYQDLCSDQPFLNQPTAAFCTGALIASDLVVTAGHCVKTDEDCHDTRLGFDYRMNSQQEAPQSIRLENLYSCKRIISRKFFRTGVDYAIIQLDRPVRGRAPLKLNLSGSSMRLGSELFLLGYPVGLPVKLSDRARVRQMNAGFFITNADAFSGNSGSPVFNPSTLEIEGLLVRGDGDFDLDRSRSCFVERRCTETGCGGESATLASVLRFPLSWKAPQPQIEEGAANGYATDGRAWLRTVIRVPSALIAHHFALSIEVYSRADRRFELVHQFSLPKEPYGGQFGFEIPFSIGDPGLLELGSVKGRITLSMDGRPIDSEVIPIIATRPDRVR